MAEKKTKTEMFRMKDTSKGSVLTFKDRMLARVKEAFEK